MARRNLLRTPEGAWYNDYAQYKVNQYGLNNDYCHQHHPYLPHHQQLALGPSDRDRPTYITSNDFGVNMTDQEKNGALGNRPPLYDRPFLSNQPQQFQPAQLPVDGGFSKRKNWDLSGGWEPPEHFSPRKTTTAYEPSFYQQQHHHQSPPSPPGSPPTKKILPWDRDQEGRGSPQGIVMDPIDGQQAQCQHFAPGTDPRMTKECQLKAKKSKQGGGALLFIRFPSNRGENYNYTAQACLHAITNDLHGGFFGISKKVFDYGAGPRSEEGCAVFQFPSLDKAEIFYRRDKRFRQHDFPPPSGHAEIFAIALQKDPNIMHTYDTLLFSEICLNGGIQSLDDYVANFKEPFTELLEDPRFEALPYAAFCVDRKDHITFRRRCFSPNNILTLHLFKRPDNLEDLMRDPRYCRLRAVHNSIATETCSIFIVHRDPCP